MQLAGKVALVTGAQQGIGRAIAIECAAAGADIAINWLDDEAAATRSRCTRGDGARGRQRRHHPGRYGGKARRCCAKPGRRGRRRIRRVRHPGQQCRRVFPRVCIDFLAMTEPRLGLSVPNVNLKGAVFCAQAAAKAMIAAGRPGAIVNITSGAAFRGSPRGVHYVASKGGIVSDDRGEAGTGASQHAHRHPRQCESPPGHSTDTAQPRSSSSRTRSPRPRRRTRSAALPSPEDIARAACLPRLRSGGFRHRPHPPCQ